MATVPDKAGFGGAGAGAFTTAVDKPFTQPNRKNAGSPAGTLVPQYSGEIVQDTTGNALWLALDTTATGWVPYVIDR